MATRRERKGRDAPPPAVVVHSLDQARAALAAARAAGCPVALRSAPDEVSRAGAGWFAALVETARAEFPDVAFTAALDCSMAPGHALGALREGVTLVRMDAPPSVRRKLARIAEKMGAALDADASPALDLADTPDPAGALARWLGRH
jgi:fructose/tagatose bisphosphate aldolase